MTIISEKIKRSLIGKEKVALYSFSEIPEYTAGALSGLIRGYDADKIDLQVNQKNLLSLMNLQKNGSRNEVKALLQITNRDDVDLHAKIRMKGDRDLHHSDFNSASFRINMKGSDRLYGLDKFSIQHPVIRGYGWEPFVANIYKFEDLLALEHKYVYLSLNGDARGLYHIEEVPTARTLEKQARKNGPIFGLEETFGSTIHSMLDVYDEDYWSKTKLYEYAKEELYSQFKLVSQGEVVSEEIFDLDEWAKYFALSDVFGIYHGTIPKSVKFYYNPVLGKFQPLLFDAHFGAGTFSDFILLDFLTRPKDADCEYLCEHENFYYAFLNNENFLEKYLAYLEKFSDEIYIQELISVRAKEIDKLNNYFYSRLYASDNIFNKGFGLYFFRKDIPLMRSNLISKRISTFHARNIVTNPVSNFLIREDLQVETAVQVIEIENFSLTGEALHFTTPTILILRGDTAINGQNTQKPMKITGDVMLVQDGGSLILENIKFEGIRNFEVYNRNWSGAINSINSDNNLNNITIKTALAEDSINLINAKFRIGNLNIENANSDAIDLDFSDGTISSLTCNAIGNDCLDTSESKVDVIGLKADGVSDKVVSIGENSTLQATSIHASRSEIGLVVKDGSTAEVETLTVEDVKLGISAFRKKPEYELPQLIVEFVNGDADVDALVDMESIINAPASLSVIRTNSEDIEAAMYGNIFGEKTKK